uniref:Uncharacterized protein n=1 Tax=Trypanosoma vivax (strain Y486) TaxID=1055687 RepID=G0TZA4_TRYVY|nr:hypothetical protein TVY486_0706250 [Trypanosoma vivax Y486]
MMGKSSVFFRCFLYLRGRARENFSVQNRLSCHCCLYKTAFLLMFFPIVLPAPAPAFLLGSEVSLLVYGQDGVPFLPAATLLPPFFQIQCGRAHRRKAKKCDIIMQAYAEVFRRRKVKITWTHRAAVCALT